MTVVAVGAGVAYRGGLLLRTGDVDDPNLKALYSAPSAPPIQYYLSPALTADVGVGFKIGSASFLTLSLVGVIESAGNDFRFTSFTVTRTVFEVPR